MVPKDLSQVKPPKINSGSEMVCRLSPVPHSRQCRRKKQGPHRRGSGATSPCLSFPTRRWGWRSHTASAGYTAFMATGMMALPSCLHPRQTRQLWRVGPRHQSSLIRCNVSPVQDWEPLFQKREVILGQGQQDPTFARFSASDLLGVSRYDATLSIFSLLLEKRAEESTTALSFLYLLHGGGLVAQRGSSGRDRWCPM